MKTYSHEYKLVPLESLFVDYHTDFEGQTIIPDDVHRAYQRNRRSVEDKIVDNGLNPDLFGALMVNARGKGKYAVVDGGTRFRAASRLAEGNGKVEVPCLVYKWSLEQEIENYIELNSVRLGIGSVDKFLAMVRLGNPEAIAINQLLREETGKEIAPSGFQCVYQIERAYRFDEGETLRSSLRVIRELGWLTQPKGMTQYIIGGVSGVLELGAKETRAVTQWRTLGTPSEVIDEGRRLSRLHASVGYGGGSRSMAKAVAIHLGKKYNTNLRTGRLDMTGLIGENGD